VQETVDGGAIWMGAQNFFSYSGGQVKVLDCDLHDYIFGDMNRSQAAKFASGTIAAYDEFLFFYCSADSTEIDRCVSYNRSEATWAIVDQNAIMARGCWADVGAFDNPLAVGVDGRLYSQENGFKDHNASLVGDRFLESGPIELGDGANILEATQMLPDERTAGQMQLTFFQRFAPNGPEYIRGPYPVTRPYTDIRVTARQVRMRLTATVDADFRFGVMRLDASQGGER
jgi:hypothetical protein